MHIIYEDNLKIFIRVLFIKYTIFPQKKTRFDEKKYIKKQSKKDEPLKPQIKHKGEAEKNQTLLDKLNLIKEILSVFLKSFSKYINVRIKRLYIRIASDDAAQTAILYGAVSAVVANILELVDSYTNLRSLKKDTVSVEPDFVSNKSDIGINISLSISVFGALVTLAKTFWKYTILKNKK